MSQIDRVAEETPSVSDKSKERKVFIAIPIYGPIDPHFWVCSMRLQEELLEKGIRGQLKPNIGDSAVGRSRNRLTREFLESDCTHLLFIDSDLVFGGEQIQRIMMHDDPIVGGVYVKKQEGDPQIVCNGSDIPTEQRMDGLMEVKYVGTGFIRVAREVFEKMIDVYRDEIEYKCDDNKAVTEWDFWRFGVYKYPDGSKRYLSEDWYFCQIAKDLGYQIWMDMAIVLKHSGNALYPLSYQTKKLYHRNPVTDSFEAPQDCFDSIREVFSSEYEFGIGFDTPPRVIDIGANAGAFSFWANFRWPGATITAYEPNPDIFSYLERNCKKIGAQAFNVAVGDTSLNRLFKGKGTRLTCSQHKNGSDESIPITVISPRDLPDCDIMKIDTEGSEVDILDRLPAFPEYLLVEYHSAVNRGRVLEIAAGRLLMLGERAHTPENGVLAFKRLERG